MENMSDNLKNIIESCIKSYLKDNLCVYTEIYTDFGPQERLRTTIELDGETITEDVVDLPTCS